MGTQYFSQQLVMLSALLDVEFQYADVLTRAINTLQISLDSGRTGEVRDAGLAAAPIEPRRVEAVCAVCNGWELC